MFYQVCKSSMRIGTLSGMWPRRHAAILGQVTDPARLGKVLAVKPGASATVAAELSIEAKSEVGKTFFGAHLHEVATERADEQSVDDALLSVQNNKEVDQQKLIAAVRETVVAILLSAVVKRFQIGARFLSCYSCLIL